MQLPALLFAALAAFLIGSVSADERPITTSPPSCSGTNVFNTGCFCSGGCTSNARAWFSCYNNAGSKPLQDIGIRFEAGYAQPSQTRSWMVANQPNWPSNLAVDLYQPNVAIGSNPTLPGPTPNYVGNTDQWYTSGVVPLSATNPTGPRMWACTKTGLLDRSLNGGFGPLQPRCFSSSLGQFLAPYSQGCQESSLFDAPTSGSLQYRGWGYAGLKVRALDGSVPTPDSPASLTIVPSTPLTASELRPFPLGGGSGLYSAGGVNMNCYVSLFNPCSAVVQTCPANTICVGVDFTAGGSVQSCPTANCCPANAVIRPTDGSAWYCCPAGEVIVTSPTTTRCCPTGQALDNNDNCCPTARIVTGTRVCCPTANFDPSRPNQCCPYAVATTGGQCCPGTGPFSTTAIPSSQNFAGTTSFCCPTANLNDQTGANIACCPTTGTNATYVDINASGNSANSVRFCCPAAQVVTSTVQDGTLGRRVCCPATGGPFTFTTNGNSQCCPNSRLSPCPLATTGGSPFCCPAGGPYTCIDTQQPCCPNSQVSTVADTTGASAARCCPNVPSGAGAQFTYFANTRTCCLNSYIIDVTPQTGAGFSGPSVSATNNRICCPGGTSATTNQDLYDFACSPTPTSSNCAWDLNSACCPVARVAIIGATAAANRANTVCCPSNGPFTSQCNSFTDCPRNPSNPSSINPCCPAGNTVSSCTTGPDLGQRFCCPTSGSVVCTAAAGAGVNDQTRRCCPSNQRPLVDGVTGNFADFCCPSSVSNPVFLNAATPCCPLANVPRDPGTTNPNFAVDLCCPGANFVVIGGACCPQGSAVRDNNGNWVCCPGGVNNPVWTTNDGCCPAVANFGGFDCCPSWSGRPSLAGLPPSAFCPTAPTAATNCWVNNANCSRINNGPQTGCCCWAASLARQATNGPTAPVDLCCDAGNSNGQWFFISWQQPCCPANRVVSAWRASPTSPDTAYCCPTTPGQVGGTNVIAGVACTYYTRVQDPNNNFVDCCRNCEISRTVADSAVVSADSAARCCPNAGQVPTLVDQIAFGYSGPRQCCPRTNVFTYQGTSYCCPDQVVIRNYDKVIPSPSGPVCCPASMSVVTPGTTTETCCPGYDLSRGNPVWADFGQGRSGNCCPPNQALTFSGTGLPNVPASNASGAPTTPAPHRFCCPAGQIIGTGAPATDAYIPAIDAISSGQVNFDTAYNNLRCCPANQVIKVLRPQNGNRVFDVCCPSPNMIWNSQTQRCCPQGVIAPPCPVPYPLTGCAGSCCPPGESGAIPTQGSSAIPNPSAGQQCCPEARIRSFLGTAYCCPPNTASTAGGSFYNNNPAQIRPCCPVTDQLTCPATIAACNATTAPYQVCCPAGDFPIPAAVASNSPPPSLIIDPLTGQCCRGYLNLPSGPRPGGNRCCPPRPGITQYFQAADDFCCVTLVNPDGTCCPTASFRTFANGTTTCCPTDTVWTSNDNMCCPIALATGRQTDGTFTDCCIDPGFTNDPGQTCCPTSTLQNGYCCPPSQLDFFGRCCINGTTPLTKYIDVSSGVPVVVTNTSVCCDSGLKDCAGFCYFLDPTDNIVKAYHVQGANGTGCCPESQLDCAGQCPDANGIPRNNGTNTDCCPDTQRGCLNGVPNTGACGAADTNCCEILSGTNCTACIAQPGCGWCNAIGASQGLCLSGDYFGPNAGVEGIVCNQTGGYRWTAVGESKIFQSINGFGDGRYIEYANVSVLLARNEPLVVPFRIRAPNDLPLDLYILQDRTNSFIQPVIAGSTYLQYGPLDVLKSNLDALDAAINALVPSGYHLGFGTFGDKAVEPFGYWNNSGWFDFVFQNVNPISANRAATIAAIKSLDPNTFAGGADIPESSMEALLHVAQNPVINWGTTRPNSLGRNVPVNKITIVVTDAPAHVASTSLAPGTRFPNTDFPDPSAGDPRDLGYYLTPSTPPVQRIALDPVNSWKAHSGLYTDTDCTNADPDTARIRQPATAFDANRQGVCSDYPSAAQVAGAIAAQGFTTVFAVADTISINYAPSAGYDFWDDFGSVDLPAANATKGLPVRLQFNVSADQPGGLVYTIREAIKNITQSITFENTTSSQFMSTVQVSFNLPPDGIQTVNVPLSWDGTDYGSSGPFPIDFQAIFPLSGYVIDVARINVYISPEKRCCFCGDGKVDPEPGCDEECDNDGSTDSICCKACMIDVGQVCQNDNLCQPVICTADGICEAVNKQDECLQLDPLDPFAFCQFNTCLAGVCVATCNSDACCNDSDPCTEDKCNSLALCQYTLLAECDCSNQAFNNCFDCVRNNDTNCAYELNSGTCFQFNQTIYEQGGYGSDVNIIPTGDEDGIKRFCIVVRPPGSKTGVIVGAVVGTLAALGLIALAAALWWRLRNGPILAPGGTANTAGANGAAATNPTYMAPVGQRNPLHGMGP